MQQETTIYSWGSWQRNRQLCYYTINLFCFLQKFYILCYSKWDEYETRYNVQRSNIHGNTYHKRYLETKLLLPYSCNRNSRLLSVEGGEVKSYPPCPPSFALIEQEMFAESFEKLSYNHEGCYKCHQMLCLHQDALKFWIR